MNHPDSAVDRFAWTGKARQGLLYAIGSVSVYWTLSRLLVILG